MQRPPSMEAILTAYEQARARAAAAAEIEAELRHALVYDAQVSGMSVRETAALLQVPKSSVARIRAKYHTGPYGGADWNPWITPETYVAANNAAWSHDPTQHITEAPFRTEIREDGTRVTAPVPAGRAACSVAARSVEPEDTFGRREKTQGA